MQELSYRLPRVRWVQQIPATIQCVVFPLLFALGGEDNHMLERIDLDGLFTVDERCLTLVIPPDKFIDESGFPQASISHYRNQVIMGNSRNQPARTSKISSFHVMGPV